MRNHHLRHLSPAIRTYIRRIDKRRKGLNINLHIAGKQFRHKGLERLYVSRYQRVRPFLTNHRNRTTGRYQKYFAHCFHFILQLQRYNKFCIYASIRVFFLRKVAIYRIFNGHGVPIGSLLTDRCSLLIKERLSVSFLKKIPALPIYSAKCDCTFEGVPMYGGGGRRYNKFCIYASIRVFFNTYFLIFNSISCVYAKKVVPLHHKFLRLCKRSN